MLNLVINHHHAKSSSCYLQLCLQIKNGCRSRSSCRHVEIALDEATIPIYFCHVVLVTCGNELVWLSFISVRMMNTALLYLFFFLSLRRNYWLIAGYQSAPLVHFMLIFYCNTSKGNFVSIPKILGCKAYPFCCLDFTFSQFNVMKKLFGL